MKYSQRVCSIAMECMQNNTLFALVILFPARIYAVQQYHHVSIFLLFSSLLLYFTPFLPIRSSIIKGSTRKRGLLFDRNRMELETIFLQLETNDISPFLYSMKLKSKLKLTLDREKWLISREITFPSIFISIISPISFVQFNLTLISRWIVIYSNRYIRFTTKSDNAKSTFC